MEDPFVQLAPVNPNDVIVIKSDDLSNLPDEQFSDFVKLTHAHFPENLVVLLGREDALETQPIEILRGLLEDLIAHQEAVERNRE